MPFAPKIAGRPYVKNLIGQRFGRLVVLEFSHVRKHAYWRCRCDCGSEKTISGRSLREGITTACGCRRGTPTHGKSDTPEYHCWQGMKVRCYLPTSRNFLRYGARGVTVCDRWRNSFENF